MSTRKALRGKSNFVSDIYLKGMLYGATIRSPYAHARIRNINTSDVPEGVTLLTAADIPGINALRIGEESMPILARETCRYAGEPVALVAGESQASVVSAILNLTVDYDELPAAVEVFDQPAPGEPAIRGVRGDVESALNNSTQVVEGTYTTGIQEHLYNEPQGAVVDVSADGTLLVHCATQWPYHVRETVAANLAIRPAKVTVSVTDTGVDLDGKLWYPSLVAAHASLLAIATGSPVKLVYSNLEDFQFTSKRAPVRITHLTGIDGTGTPHAARVKIEYNCGAYPLFTGEITDRLAATAPGWYGCRNVSVEIHPLRTNLPPMNIMSGFGTASTQFAAETHVSRIIEITQSDPVAWRADRLYMGAHRNLDISLVRRTLDRVVTASDFDRKHAAFSLQRSRRDEHSREAARGIGLAVATDSSGFTGGNESRFASSIAVRLEKDTTAVLRTSIAPRAGSLRQHWVDLVAAGLGLDPEQVQLESGRTGDLPDTGPSTLSRSVMIADRLIKQACATIQKRRFRDPLPIEVRRSYRVPKSVTWDSSGLSGVPFANSAFGAAVVEVSVDPISFESRVDDVWLTAYAGRILDRESAMHSLEMGVYQALEWTTHETVEFRHGAIDPRSYLSYRGAVQKGLPRIHIEVLGSENGDPCGVGSLPFSCVPSAVATAVSQATGRYMDRLPTNPELIHGYLEQE